MIESDMEATMMHTSPDADDPAEVARQTQDVSDPAGDAADQAERLTMTMEAEAIRSALSGDRSGEGSLDGLDTPLEDVEFLLAAEGAEDGSDDPAHAGGLRPARLLSPEESALHIVSAPEDPLNGEYVDEIVDDDSDVDPFDRPGSPLTPEDETMLGIDPYE